MAIYEKLAWAAGSIAAGGLILYSVIIMATTSFATGDSSSASAAPMIWTIIAICAAIAGASFVILRGRTQETDQRDAWTLGIVYRGKPTAGLLVLLTGGILPALALLGAGQYTFANALFTGLLWATVVRSIIDLVHYRRRHVAPRIDGPAEIRGEAI
ncbi:hypothetical protein ACFY5D_06730 [Paeniglutamicibacter sp. NPDC012692]|uniref:hypothetical protein n=1 Tax=Paeniglutamicibacter sp. NPDC012692 TaxID=3364388 RepID=UPI0036C3B4AD